VKLPGATDRVITCSSVAEAREALAAATRVLEQLGVRLNLRKTRIVHLQQGFDFLGYRIVRTQRKRKLPASMIRRKLNSNGLIAYPTDKSIRRFRDRVRALTRRCAPLTTEDLIQELNQTLRGWRQYYKRAHVRTLVHKLDGWVVRRIWSHRFRRWRCGGWQQLPPAKLYGEFGLVN
jgi:RNA-directed DNA polymerase